MNASIKKTCWCDAVPRIDYRDCLAALDDLDAVSARLRAAEAEVERMRAALRYYAGPNSHGVDDGHVARAALGEP